MTDIRVTEDFWQTNALPAGILESWLVEAGTDVFEGDPIAAVRIEDALHEILAPAAGRLIIWQPINSLVEPGSALGEISD